jgi:nucleotide-binding universal stress UspA family protein
MVKVLVPFDGSDHAKRAVNYVIELIQQRVPFEIHLLMVQEPLGEGIYTQEVFEKSQRPAGEKVLAEARELLDKASIPYSADVRRGPIAETIAAYCKEHQCDAVIMGTRGMGRVAGLVLGSVASKVIHLVDVPVTLVK